MESRVNEQSTTTMISSDGIKEGIAVQWKASGLGVIQHFSRLTGSC